MNNQSKRKAKTQNISVSHITTNALASSSSCSHLFRHRQLRHSQFRRVFLSLKRVARVGGDHAIAGERRHRCEPKNNNTQIQNRNANTNTSPNETTQFNHNRYNHAIDTNCERRGTLHSKPTQNLHKTQKKHTQHSKHHNNTSSKSKAHEDRHA